MEEAWLEGKIEGVLPVLMPAAHALMQSARDIEKACAELTAEEIWRETGGAASVGFHLKHISGSIDRLLSYAKGLELSEKQFENLRNEQKPDLQNDVKTQVGETLKSIGKMIEEIKETPETILFEARAVGRKRLPTNVFGLLFHIAEHTQRHVGQIVTTAKFIKNSK